MAYNRPNQAKLRTTYILVMKEGKKSSAHLIAFSCHFAAHAYVRGVVNELSMLTTFTSSCAGVQLVMSFCLEKEGQLALVVCQITFMQFRVGIILYIYAGFVASSWAFAHVLTKCCAACYCVTFDLCHAPPMAWQNSPNPGPPVNEPRWNCGHNLDAVSKLYRKLQLYYNTS